MSFIAVLLNNLAFLLDDTAPEGKMGLAEELQGGILLAIEADFPKINLLKMGEGGRRKGTVNHLAVVAKHTCG
jgi:hypothetical protein